MVAPDMSILSRHVSAPRGSKISCKGWPQEAALRMLMNNLDPDVAARPDELIVYGGSGRAARSWPAFDAIVAALRRLEHDDTLIVQSGKPVAVFRTHTAVAVSSQSNVGAPVHRPSWSPSNPVQSRHGSPHSASL